MAVALVPQWTLADRLAKARHLTRLSQEDFGHLLGISGGSVKRYEAGTHEPKRATVLGWAVACGVDPVWLETGEAEHEGDESGTIAVTKGYLVAA